MQRRLAGSAGGARRGSLGVLAQLHLQPPPLHAKWGWGGGGGGQGERAAACLLGLTGVFALHPPGVPTRRTCCRHS